MISTLKSEFRKLFTVRSTYVITGLVILAVIIIAFWLEGWRLTPLQLTDPTTLASDVFGGLGLTVFGAIVAILLMSHEYRYNTILYTLTNSNSRTKVLLSKFITISVYALCLTVVIGILAPLMSYLGVHAHGHSFVHQSLQYWNLAWRSLFYGWGYAMAGLVLALLTRNQIASIVVLLLFPGLAESLLGLLFKHNTVYLPFHSLNQVIGNNASGSPFSNNLSPLKAAGVFCIYLAVGWIVAWILFQKRDAA